VKYFLAESGVKRYILSTFDATFFLKQLVLIIFLKLFKATLIFFPQFGPFLLQIRGNFAPNKASRKARLR
jgi:hypothetical protein